MNWAIILTAGQSRRMKGINKIFYKIKGKPLIFYTISAFEKHPKIDRIILVGREADFKKFPFFIKKYKFQKIAKLVKGGNERQDSAFEGLKTAGILGTKSGDLILFHNGCNPLISQKEISEVIKAAKKYKAALIGQPARDTIKEITQDKFITKTIDRNKIFLAQTPQVIEYNLAKKAFEKADQENFRATDDISLVERLGKRVKVIPGSFRNIKITYPEDLQFVNSYIRKFVDS